MKRWFTAFIISIFALAAVSLVIMQLVQTRRTFSISDNMFNVSVNTAMEEVIRQLNGEELQGDGSVAFNYKDLDSLIVEELLLVGIDMHPVVGLYDGNQGSFLYSSDSRQENLLEESPYRYSFQPIGVVSSTPLYIILAFPHSFFPRFDSNLYLYFCIFLVLVIAIMFVFSLRTISNQQRLDKMKNEFISNMTHEIKTPISTISLACEMLQETETKNTEEDAASQSPLSTYIGIIADENARMRLLVETILQSSKMSGGNFQIKTDEVDMHRIITHVMQSFRLTVEGRSGVIETHLDADSPIIYGDELHLTNLVYNLVDNGIKYSSKAPHIVISTSRNSHHFVLKVQDHGIGIPKADQKRVFEKFYRVSTGNVHNVKGFGIGLNYVAQVVRLHHGSISLESEVGKGSVFAVSFPI